MFVRIQFIILAYVVPKFDSKLFPLFYHVFPMIRSHSHDVIHVRMRIEMTIHSYGQYDSRRMTTRSLHDRKTMECEGMCAAAATMDYTPLQCEAICTIQFYHEACH